MTTTITTTSTVTIITITIHHSPFTIPYLLDPFPVGLECDPNSTPNAIECTPPDTPRAILTMFGTLASLAHRPKN